MIEISGKEFLTITEAMNLLGCTKTTIYTMAKASKIKKVVVARKVYISKDSIDKLFEGGEV